MGYIITDPETGSGAYIIEGSGNGGALILAAIIIFSLFFFQIVAIATVASMGVTALAGAAGLIAPLLLKNFVDGNDVIGLAILRGLTAVAVVGLIGGALPALGLVALLVQGILSIAILMYGLASDA